MELNPTDIRGEFNKSTLEEIKGKTKFPVIPLKDTVIFPFILYPVLAGRETTIKAINSATDSDKYVLLVAQIDFTAENPDLQNLYKTGTIAKILQVLRMPNGLLKVLVDGIAVANVLNYNFEDYIEAEVEIRTTDIKEDNELIALSRQVKKLFIDYINVNQSIPKETVITFENISDYERRVYFIASTLNIELKKKQQLLEISDIKKLYYELLYILNSELEISNMIKEIDNKVNSEIQRSQRRFIIQEQIKILQDELNEGIELDPDLKKILEKIESAGMPENVKEKALEEFNKLKKTPSMSPDFSVTRNYLDWMVSVPWNVFTEDNYDLENAKKILDEDHYDLDKPKERILELLAILKLLKSQKIKKYPKGQILCFVGPPGVGKTSLGKSIARALNRKFARLSVGGVRDEAEIRGHRRTYIGSMPGKIIQAMKKTGTCNPVILIDEIDKMGTDWRGDPASAMLEVLDPEQNNTFNDHYLDVDYDLSNVLFITTANVQYSIPPALRDRMEIIEMRSYLDFEKIEIAKRHIIPKELQEHGLTKDAIKFPDNVILKIIREYTKEAGVRNLERELTSIIRKVIREIVTDSKGNIKTEKNQNSEKPLSLPKRIVIKTSDVPKYLGVPKYVSRKSAKEKHKIGTATGLAWTTLGGDILTVDVTVMEGQEKFILTGQLGDVMKESAQAGLSFIKSNMKKFDIPKDFFKNKEIHIHVPEGAIPKDGPSAGITMTIAMLSAITRVPARTDVAMTGEITLRGEILPVGGLNEKMLAALRSGIKTVLIPKENEKDLDEVAKEIKDNLNIILVKNILESLPYIFDNGELKFKRKKNE